LAMVFDQASLAGGTVRIANRQSGGARVTLRLPLRPATEAPSSETKLVLLVEDSPEIRTYVRETLVALGHQVIEAETAADALSLAQIPDIGFVLSDIQLRGDQTGLELLRELETRHPGLSCGLMTSLPASNQLHRDAAASFHVLAKPFSPAELDGFLSNCSLASITRAQ